MRMISKKTWAAVIITATLCGGWTRAFGAEFRESIKLPYEKGESFVVVQGYDSPPTHIHKDRNAIDFSKNGCDAYGKPAVAASSGNVLLVQEVGYNGGYGTQLLIKNPEGIVSRYAHLMPGTVSPQSGDIVVRGEAIGKIGNSGLVAGAACPVHPGAHLHFAMYEEAAEHAYAPYLPEPISGYSGIAKGKWYLSDNEMGADSLAWLGALLDDLEKKLYGEGKVLGAATSSIPEIVFMPMAPTATVAIAAPPPSAPIFSGGVAVSVAPPSMVSSQNPSPPQPVVVSSTVTTSTMATSTVAAATSTQPATSTITLPSQLDHSVGVSGPQKISFVTTTTINGFALWTRPQQGYDVFCCSESFLSFAADASGTPGVEIATSDPVRVRKVSSDEERVYGFRAPVLLAPGDYWFSLQDGPTQLNGTDYYGSPSGTYYFRVL